MARNNLCLNQSDVYTAVGINALCEGLKGSAITSLKCARSPQTHKDTAC